MREPDSSSILKELYLFQTKYPITLHVKNTLPKWIREVFKYKVAFGVICCGRTCLVFVGMKHCLSTSITSSSSHDLFCLLIFTPQCKHILAACLCQAMGLSQQEQVSDQDMTRILAGQAHTDL